MWDAWSFSQQAALASYSPVTDSMNQLNERRVEFRISLNATAQHFWTCLITHLNHAEIHVLSFLSPLPKENKNTPPFCPRFNPSAIYSFTIVILISIIFLCFSHPLMNLLSRKQETHKDKEFCYFACVSLIQQHSHFGGKKTANLLLLISKPAMF